MILYHGGISVVNRPEIIDSGRTLDRVYACLNAFENKFMTFETAIHELRAYKLADQISFHTDEGLDLLKFLEYETIQVGR